MRLLEAAGPQDIFLVLPDYSRRTMITLKRLVIFLVVVGLLGVCGSPFSVKSFAPTPDHGVAISGVISKPEGDGPFPAVIILHGCSGVTDLDFQWAQCFKEWGYASLVLDSHSPRNILLNCKHRKVTTLE